MDNTFIKLYRKIDDWEWYKDIPTKVLFFHLLIKVNFTEKKWQGRDIKKWEIITSLDRLAHETGLTVMQVRTALTKLKSTSEITSHSTSTFTHIQLVKWEQYQSNVTSQVTNQQQTDNKPITTTKEGNKEKKERNNTYTEGFEIFWKEYPNRVGKPDAMKKYKEQEHSEIIEWLERWKEFWDYSETEPRFIPHPATWLNQERYKDEPPETKTKTLSFTI